MNPPPRTVFRVTRHQEFLVAAEDEFMAAERADEETFHDQGDWHAEAVGIDDGEDEEVLR